MTTLTATQTEPTIAEATTVEPTSADYARANKSLSSFDRDPNLEAHFLVGYLGSLVRTGNSDSRAVASALAYLRIHDARMNDDARPRTT